MDAVGDKDLRTVKHPLVTVANGVGPDALHVGARARFCHCESADHFTCNHARKPVRFLCLSTVSAEIGRYDIGVNAIARCEATKAHSRQLFDHRERHVRSGSRTAVGLIDIRAE